MTEVDWLFRYKAQLEANTAREWTWAEVAKGMEMDNKTLRVVRYHPEKANVRSLRRAGEFFEKHNVRFSVSQFLAELEASGPIPQPA